ncbi:hypothetical protein FRC08_009206 [Ceratobasidium sp. 394]|nr:hypothetical protein FRC08_009206 [Ceratobasidium sp. 394]KAG9091397.1 hypothetical protein FS749_016578 [Ceratobasidium sp. UAMH 11750]
MATVTALPTAPVVPSQPRRMPRRLTISIVNDPPNFSALAPLPTTVAGSSASGSTSPVDDLTMAPPGLGGRRLSVTRSSPKVNPYAAGGTLCELSEVEEPTVSPTPAARPRLLPSSTSFFVQTPAARPSTPMKVNPYAAGGALSESAPTPTPTPKPTSVESKPIVRPFNLRVLTTRQIQDMARAAQTAHNNQVQARMVAESILNRVRRRSQRRRFPRFGGVIGLSQPGHSPLRKLAFDESDVSDDSASSDGGSAFGDWSSEDGSDEESLEEWERQLGDVSWFVDNGYD